MVQRHADHIRKCIASCDDAEQSEELEHVPPIPEQEAPVKPTLCHSQRIRKPPDHFQN